MADEVPSTLKMVKPKMTKIRIKIKVLVIVIILCLFIVSKNLMAQSMIPLYSGEYGQSLYLAVNDKEQTVSGYFYVVGLPSYERKMYSSDCQFYFYGKLKNKQSAEVLVMSLESIDNKPKYTTGTISATESGEESVVIKLHEIFHSCNKVDSLLKHKDLSRDLPQLNDLIEMRIIATHKSYFYPSAISKNHKKAYVTCGDIVRVTEKNPVTDRVMAEYIGKRSITTGWILQKDLLNIGRKLNCPEKNN